MGGLAEQAEASIVDDDLGLDSSDLMVLTLKIEEAIGAPLDEQRAAEVRTLGEASDLLYAVLVR